MVISIAVVLDVAGAATVDGGSEPGGHAGDHARHWLFRTVCQDAGAVISGAVNPRAKCPFCTMQADSPSVLPLRMVCGECTYTPRLPRSRSAAVVYPAIWEGSLES